MSVITDAEFEEARTLAPEVVRRYLSGKGWRAELWERGSVVDEQGPPYEVLMPPGPSGTAPLLDLVSALTGFKDLHTAAASSEWSRVCTRRITAAGGRRSTAPSSTRTPPGCGTSRCACARTMSTGRPGHGGTGTESWCKETWSHGAMG
ncbi:hypothetical protein ACFTTN_34890 [Streptomyces niveus]|uniref:hypothetical protein n=1 Tax=Streptomyces niveus TaxID=193462 RepID=UPI003643943D